MSAQGYYRDHSPRPQSPPTDVSGDHDHYNVTDVDEQTGVPERATSPHRLDTLLSPAHERPHSGYTQVSYEESNDEEGGNRYGNNYNMPSEESKEALVSPGRRPRSSGYQDLEYADVNPVGQATLPLMDRGGEGKFSQWIGNVRQPLEQRIQNKQNGIGRQRRPYIVYALTLAMLGVLIYELVYNAMQQGNPFSFKPTVNPMLGPSSTALITLGARFPPCMKVVSGIPLNTNLPCANDTANPPTITCSIEQICAFGGFKGQDPDQSFRFVTPIFLHAGLIHFFFNMLAQVTAAAQIEREMGSAGFIITYMAAGIFGNVLGGNFARPGVPSLGASGAIFGMFAVEWVDLFAHWRYIYRPGRRLAFLAINLLIGIAIGFIPYIDNFAHLGGFLMGLLVGTILYPIISPTRRHALISWCFRLAALPLVIVLFVVLIRNFYTSDPYAACSWCRYLSCIPTSSNDYCKGTGLTITNN